MKKRIINMSELKDSRLMFDKNPPAFGYLFLALVGIFLLITVAFAIRTPKLYTIVANGTVTSEDANYVMSTVTGEIDECYLAEGKIVNEGDVLFTVKSTDYDLQYKQLVSNREAYVSKVDKYNLLVKSIKDDKNYFDENNSEDQLYYSTFEKYKSQVKQNNIDVSSYKAYGYTDEQIEKTLIGNESKIMEVYYAAIQAAENAKSEASMQIEAIDAQLGAVDLAKGTYAVKATTSGTIHMLQEYKSGMVVQVTTAVATITPQNATKIIKAYVSTADMARMHVGDRAKITVDGLSQNVYGTISGNIIAIDSDVTTNQGSDGGSYQMFRITISVDNDYLISNTGNKVNLSNGMTVNARVSYDQVTYFNYALEKLGIKVR